MPPSLDWEFEDEPQPSKRMDAGSGVYEQQQRWLRRGAALLLLLALVLLAVRAVISARQRAIAELEADLRATVELELRTIANSDQELFATLQDPTDPAWSAQQAARYFLSGGTLFPPAPGLVPAERAGEITRIDLNGLDARVELVRWFQGTELPGPQPFALTWFYRRTQAGDWYHVAAQDDAWRQSFFASVPLPDWTGPLLQIQATQAEAAILDQISLELGRLVAEACDWLDCPYVTRYRLVFDDIPSPGLQGNLWSLPTLYFSGQPENEGALDMWTRALKTWMVEALTQAQLVARPRSDNDVVMEASGSGGDAKAMAGVGVVTDRLVFRAFVQRLQAELALREPGLSDSTLLSDAVAAGRQHALDMVWQARADPGDPEGTLLLSAEANALLDMLEQQMGSERLFSAFPGLLERPGALDLEAIYDLDQDSPSAAWYAFLSELTREPIVPLSTFPIITAEVQLPESSPPLAPMRPLSPDDQIALMCDGRIWVGHADGSDLAPLTPRGEQFTNPSWSPDGRWLLVRGTEQHPAGLSDGVADAEPAAGLQGEAGLYGTLYLISTEDAETRALVSAPTEKMHYRGFSPDGRLLVYSIGSDVRAVDIAAGETRRLPGKPVWSPDGEQMVFVAGNPRRPWLAEADWAEPRTIATHPGLGWASALWSSDSERLAMNVNMGYPYNQMIAVYDLETQHIMANIELIDLIKALARSDGSYLANGAKPTGTDYRSQRSVWPLGWSADGGHLLVWGQWTKGPLAERDLTLLVAIPVDNQGADPGADLAPKVIAYGEETFLSNVAWSPIDPDRLILKWRLPGDVEPIYETHLVSLNTGSLYQATDVIRAAWAPDGAGLALLSENGIRFVDRDGNERFAFETPGTCDDIAWNPEARLETLRTR